MNQELQSLRTVAAALSFGMTALLCGGPASARIYVEGDLPRQAELGLQTQSAADELRVSSVTAGAPAANAGLLPGDVIMAINGRDFTRDYHGAALLEVLVGNQPVSLQVRRNGADTAVEFTPPPKPFEEIEGLDSYYGVIGTPDGARLRTIITRPAGSREPLPALFVVQWVSCDSVEFNRPGAWVPRNLLFSRSYAGFAKT